MGQKGPAVAGSLRPGTKQHQAKIGVIGVGKAVGNFGNTRQATVQKQARTVALRRVRTWWGIGEEFCRLPVGVDRAFDKQPVVRGITVECGNQRGIGGQKFTELHGLSA